MSSRKGNYPADCPTLLVRSINVLTNQIDYAIYDRENAWQAVAQANYWLAMGSYVAIWPLHQPYTDPESRAIKRLVDLRQKIASGGKCEVSYNVSLPSDSHEG